MVEIPLDGVENLIKRGITARRPRMITHKMKSKARDIFRNERQRGAEGGDENSIQNRKERVGGEILGTTPTPGAVGPEKTI